MGLALPARGVLQNSKRGLPTLAPEIINATAKEQHGHNNRDNQCYIGAASYHREIPFFPALAVLPLRIIGG